MSETIRFEIVTPVRSVYNGTATSVVLPSENGEIEVLPGHRAMLSLIRHGSVVVTEPGGEKRYMAVETGYVDIVDDEVTLLVGGCVQAGEVDPHAAENAIKRGQGLLADPRSVSEEELELQIAAFEYARAQLDALKRMKK